MKSLTKKNIIIFITIFFTIVSENSSSQTTSNLNASKIKLEVGPLINVSSDEPTLPHVEPTIAVNPKNPNHIVITSIMFRDKNSLMENNSMTLTVFNSMDGGSTWNRIVLPDLQDAIIAADPWLSWSNSDTLHLSCLVWDDQKITTWLYKTVDGVNWSLPLKYVFGKKKQQDHTILLRPSLASKENVIGMIATATDTISGFFEIVQSEDFGNTFHSLKRYGPDTNNNNISSAVMLNENEYVFCYHDMTPPDYSFWVVKTFDGKNFTRTLMDSTIMPMGFQAMTIDNVKFKPRIYLLWLDVDKSNNENLNVVLSYSDDKGSSWTDPIRLNTNTTPSVKAVPFVSVNNRGDILVAWADFRNCTTSGCYDVYITASTDGGKNFLSERRVTPKSSHIFTEGNGAVANRYRISGGDYWFITSDSNGDFYLTWGDSSTDVYQIMMTKIKILD